jgi:hypothetical protein
MSMKPPEETASDNNDELESHGQAQIWLRAALQRQSVAGVGI